MVGFALLAQVLRQTGDAGDRIADLMGNTGGQPADAGQAFGMYQTVFQLLGLGEVFDQQHQATVTGRQRLGDCGFVQVQAAAMAVQLQPLFVQVLFALLNEIAQQALPWLGDGGQT